MIEISKKFSKKIIATMFVTIIIFLAVVIVCNIKDVQIQTELIIGFFGLFVGEFGFMAYIKTRDK